MATCLLHFSALGRSEHSDARNGLLSYTHAHTHTYTHTHRKRKRIRIKERRIESRII